MDNRARAATIVLLLLVASSLVSTTALSAEDACIELQCGPDLTLLDEGFDGYPAGADPPGWYDTARNNSLDPANDFQVYDLGGDPALGTTSKSYNIHSHFVTAESADWRDYTFTGRMMIGSSSSGIGVTFLSRFPDADAYYRLRRYGDGAFEINAHDTAVTAGSVSTGVVPSVGVWYRFRIEVWDTGSETRIRARVWAEGATEPTDWPADCTDSSATRLTAGRVGVWAMARGTKYWDDLLVQGDGCAPGPVDCDDGDACTVDDCDSASGCYYADLVCDDDDPDTIDRCDPTLGCLFCRPSGEAEDLCVETSVCPETVQNWLPPSPPPESTVLYDTLRSPDPADFLGGAVRCVEAGDGDDTQSVDPYGVDPGQTAYYLIRARDDCFSGAGGLGSGSDGVPRLGIACEAVSQPPVATIAADPTSGFSPLAVQFDGSASTDPDGAILSWEWQFGDGATAAGATTAHEYDAPGLFTATLTVTDNTGMRDSDSLVIDVQQDGSFLDHFDAATIDGSRWKLKQSGAGSVGLSDDSYAMIESPQSADAAFLQYAPPIDLTRSQTWLFALRRIDGGDLPDLVALWRLPDGEEPQPDGAAELALQRVAGISMVDAGQQPSMRFALQPAAGGPLRYWNGDPANQWTTPGTAAEAIAPIRQGDDADWYVAGLEIDGENGRFRLAGFHRVGYGIQDALQGPRLLALTDWVDWADAGQGSPASKIWLTIGDRHAEQYDAEYHVEWVRFETGTTLRGWTNARATGSDGYRLRLQQSQGTQFLPAQRGGDVLPIGGAGSWDSDSHRKKHVIRDHDGTHYLFYEGMNALRESEIGLATAPGPEGPWTPAAQNPVVPRTVLPSNGENYDVLTAPWVIKDDAEPDPDKRWRLMACGEVRNSSIHRMFLLSAPAADGPWSLEPGAGPDGSVLAGSGSGDWKGTGVCDPVIWWDSAESRWAMFYSGIRQDYGWSVGYAVSPDLLQWNEEPSNPLVTADPGGVQLWTSVNGNRLTIADASSFREDGIVIIRNGSTEEDWGLSRVRAIVGNQLELYHEVTGVSGTASTRAVAMLGSGSITPHALVRDDDGTFRLFVTAFQPFILDAGSFGNCELVGSLVAPTVLGPWQWDDLGSPQVPPNRWSADRAQENLGLVNHPVNSAP